MARRSSKGNGLGFLILLPLALLFMIPKEAWIAIGAICVLAVVIYLAKRASNKPPSDEAHTQTFSTIPQYRSQARSSWNEARPERSSVEPFVAPRSSVNKSEPTGFRIPAPSFHRGEAIWHPPGSTAEIAGRKIDGGLIYVGTSLLTARGETDPCLIDPSLPVASHGDMTLRQTDYWPSYSVISSSARAAYLEWHVSGRRNPTADLGHVFLFFYGLERRAVIDSTKDEAARGDWPAIEAELNGLLAVYGPKSSSFRSYATGLLSWVQAGSISDKQYLKPFPTTQRSAEFPLMLRIALGQAVADGEPIPGHLALSWVRLAPDVAFRTPATRCPEEFTSLFLGRYAQMFGQGLTIQPNRTKIKMDYRPASSGLIGYKELSISIPNIPDVSVLTAPLKKLVTLVEDVTQSLESYSRYLGRNPDALGSFEASLLLPEEVRSPALQNIFADISSRLKDGAITVLLEELQDLLKAKPPIGREAFTALTSALESAGIGIEPNVLHGAKLPKPEDRVALFSLPPGDGDSTPTAAYQSAMLTVQLGSAVAAVDGQFDESEAQHLDAQISTWSHLTPRHLAHLHAQVCLLRQAPVTLTAIRKKLDVLDSSSKEAVALFMATLAQVDGVVAPSEVKLLEKVYKALGLEPNRVFSDLHAAAAGASPGVKAKAENQGFALDPAKIAELHKDTAQVSALLSQIFVEEEHPASAIQPQDEEELTTAERFLGLDDAHASFARLLFTREEWSRGELEDAAADLDLMLDGALEQINEVSFDKFDLGITEGEDPISVNREIMEKIAA